MQNLGSILFIMGKSATPNKKSAEICEKISGNLRETGCQNFTQIPAN